MGMFDWLKVEVPLPDGYKARGGFQTKDFDCIMAEYVISSEGRLLRPVSEVVEDASRPMGFYFKTVGHEDTNYHGMIYFYDTYRDFAAKFTDGALVSIVRIEYDEITAAQDGGESGGE